MPQLDLDGANSKVSADKLASQSGTTVELTAGHKITNFASTGIDDNAAGATAITIDSDEKVGIITTTPGSYEAEASQFVVGTNSGNNGMSIVSGTSNVGSIYFADGTTGTEKYVGYITYTHSTNRFSFGAGAATRLALDSDGLKFGTDTAAANALSDYEEGTWTPVIGGLSGVSGQSYSNQSGTYTKIGRMVHVNCSIDLSTKGTISGLLTLNGLPFTVLNSGSQRGTGSCGNWGNLASSLVHCTVYASENTSFGYIRGATAGTATLAGLSTSDLHNNSYFYFSMSYMVS